MKTIDRIMFAALIITATSTSIARADDVTINGADVTASSIQATITANGGGKIIFATSHTLDVDQNLLDLTGIVVNNGITGEIDFGSNSFGVVFKDSTTIAIDMQGGGASLNMAGTSTTAGIGTVGTGDTITLNGAITGATTGNITTGTNTLTLLAGASIAGFVSVPAGQTLDVNGDASIGTLNDNGNALNIDIADGVTLTVGTPALTGTTTLTGADETDSILELDGSSTISSISISGSARIQVDADTTITSLTNGAGQTLDLDIADDVTLTVTTPNFAGTTTAIGADFENSILVLNSGSTIADLTVSGLLNIAINATTLITDLATSGSDAVFFDLPSNVQVVVTNPSLAGFTLASGEDLDSGFSVTNASTINYLSLRDTITAHFGDATTVTTLSAETGSTIKLDIDAALGITAFAAIGFDHLTFDIASGLTATVTGVVTIIADQVIELVAVDGGGNETINFVGDLVLSGINSNLKFTNDTGRIAGEVQMTGSGSSIDVDGNSEIETFTPNVNSTINFADGKSLTLDNGITVAAPATLTLDGTTGSAGETFTVPTIVLATGGAATLEVGGDTANTFNVLSTIGASASTRLEVNTSTNITSHQLGGASTIAVADGATLATVATINASPLALEGTGTITRIDSTTGLIADTGGVTISDLRADPSGTTTILVATDVTTTVSLSNALTTAGDVLNKTGDGTLIVKTGLTDIFDNGAGMVIDIDAGTLVAGTTGSNDDVTFDDDADEIQIADGATFRTTGSITVGDAGANANIDAVSGSTVELSSAAGAETLTAAADEDFKLLGSVLINGTDSDYSIADAFEYQFGDVTINATGSLIHNTPSGKMRFVSGSTLLLNGTATLDVDGQASGTPVTMDTTDGTPLFTINRGSSANFTLTNAALTNARYRDDSGLPASCSLTFTDLTLVDELNWTGPCSGGGGGGGGGGAPPTPPPSDDDEEETTDEEEATDENAEDDDAQDDNTDTSDDETNDDDKTENADSDGETAADDDGSATVEGDNVDVNATGLDPGTQVTVESNDDGETTLTVGDGENASLTVTIGGLDDGSDVALAIDDDGNQSLSFTNAEGDPLLDLSVEGVGDGAKVDVVIDENGNRSIEVTDANGQQALTLELDGFGDAGNVKVTVDANNNKTVVLGGANRSSTTLSLQATPSNSTVKATTDATGNLKLAVTDPTGDNVGVSMTVPAGSTDTVFTIAFGSAPDAKLAGKIAGAESNGLVDNYIVGATVQISADPLPQDPNLLIELAYPQKSIGQLTESELRLNRYNNEAEAYEPAGSNDVGDQSPTDELNDGGIETSTQQVWARVSQLGTFSIGVPEQPVEETNETNRPTGICGAFGMITLPLCLLGLGAIKQRRTWRLR